MGGLVGSSCGAGLRLGRTFRASYGGLVHWVIWGWGLVRSGVHLVGVGGAGGAGRREGIPCPQGGQRSSGRPVARCQHSGVPVWWLASHSSRRAAVVGGGRSGGSPYLSGSAEAGVLYLWPGSRWGCRSARGRGGSTVVGRLVGVVRLFLEWSCWWAGVEWGDAC